MSECVWNGITWVKKESDSQKKPSPKKEGAKKATKPGRRKKVK